jgi:protein-disulfide isomerase
MGGASRSEKKRKQEAADARLRAAGITPPAAKDSRRTTFIAVAVLAVVGLVVGVVVLMNRDTAEPVAATYPVAADGGVVVAGTGPIVVDVYADYICPICERFEERYGTELAAAMNAGQITVRYHGVAILDSYSEPAGYSSRAANAALCSVPAGIFPAYHQRLFTDQPAEGSAGLSDEELTAFGTELGADLGACISGGANAAAVTAVTDAAVGDESLRNENGDFGTPTVLLDGARVDVSDTGWLQKALNPAS